MEQGKIMEAEVPTVRMGATPIGLTAPPPPQLPRFFTDRMPFLPPNQPRQSIEGKKPQEVFNCYMRNFAGVQKRFTTDSSSNCPIMAAVA